MLIYSHNPKSQGAKQLALALGAKRIRHNSPTFKGRHSKTVINWGASILPQQVLLCNLLNEPESVNVASDKLNTFNALKHFDNKYILPFTNDIEVAKQWINENGCWIVCRTLLRASEGRGIVIAQHESELVPAPLYVRYKKKKEEYRLHVMDKNIISVQKKARKLSSLNVNWQIRNHSNGFIFKREGVLPPDDINQCALDSVRDVGLDFGAVDIIWNEYDKKPYVLEINTAPGLQGQTILDYARAFRTMERKIK